MAEGARLESVCAGNRTAGSNPALSAKFESVFISDKVRNGFMISYRTVTPSKTQFDN